MSTSGTSEKFDQPSMGDTPRHPPAYRRGCHSCSRIVSAGRLCKVRWIFAAVPLACALFVVLTTESRSIEFQPYPDSHSYLSEAMQISRGEGLKIDFDETRSKGDSLAQTGALYPSRYPPTFPLVLSPFAFFAGDSGVFVAVKVFTALLVLVCWAIARHLGGLLAASIVALIFFVSPFASDAASLILSDAFGALLILIIFGLLLVTSSESTGSRRESQLAFLAGLIAGIAFSSRLALIVVPIALLMSVRGRIRYRWMVLGLMPMVMLLGTYQTVEFGAPWRTGYDYYEPDRSEFNVDYLTRSNPPSDRSFLFDDRLDGALMGLTCPCDEYGPMGLAGNIVFYPALLLGLYWVYFPPLFSLFAVVWWKTGRNELASRFAILIAGLNMILMMFYYYQGARLMAPTAILLLVLASVGASDTIRWLVRRIVRRDLQSRV